MSPLSRELPLYTAQGRGFRPANDSLAWGSRSDPSGSLTRLIAGGLVESGPPVGDRGAFDGGYILSDELGDVIAIETARRGPAGRGLRGLLAALHSTP